MLTPLTYERVRTLDDPSDELGTSPDIVWGPQEADAGGEAQRAHLHPLHWLLDGHWLGRWRTPLVLRIWRYGAGSIFAFLTSTVVLSICFSWLNWGAFTSSTVAFFAGAVPNWILNRRWAWQRRGREGMGRETTLYVSVSLVSWLASSGATKLTAVAANHAGAAVRDVLVVASYMFSIVVLTGLKYVAYDRLVFVDRSKSGAGAAGVGVNEPGERRRSPSSRHQVRSTTEQNRMP